MILIKVLIFLKTNKDIFNQKVNPLILMFKDQRFIRCTEDHKFYVVNRGWIEAQNIEINDRVYSENRIPCDAELEYKIKANFEEDVYDISMPVNHWFYANELLVHNCYTSDIDDCIWEGENKPSIYKTLLNHALTFKASGGTSANLSSCVLKGRQSTTMSIKNRVDLSVLWNYFPLIRLQFLLVETEGELYC